MGLSVSNPPKSAHSKSWLGGDDADTARQAQFPECDDKALRLEKMAHVEVELLPGTGLLDVEVDKDELVPFDDLLGELRQSPDIGPGAICNGFAVSVRRVIEIGYWAHGAAMSEGQFMKKEQKISPLLFDPGTRHQTSAAGKRYIRLYTPLGVLRDKPPR